MILAIIFAQVWGVIQLIVLTSLSRTVRVRTVLAAMAVGFYAIGPITAFIQLSWIRIAAHLFGKVVSDLTGTASYTVDPFIEEAMKLLPLFVLFLIPAIRRQWSITDCLLIAAATGSGFGLAEHLFRYADYASTAQSVSGGYAMTIGSATPLVPGIVRTLTSWIPLGVFFESSAVRVNWHLAWSAITGLAVGLFLRNPKKWARPTAVALIVLVCLNHAAGNAASVQYTWLSGIAGPMRFLDSILAFLVLVAVGVAWWLDQSSQRAWITLGPLLNAEQSAPTHRAGTLTAAVSRLPWSIPWVLGFDRARRAYHAARAAAPAADDDMRDAIVAERDRIDRKLTQREAQSLLPTAWMPNNLGTTVLSALRRPSVIIWLVLIAPSFLYLIIGGFPATSGLQTAMKGPIVWPLILLITLCNQGRKLWRVVTGVRMLPAAVRHPMGDDAAMLTLQAATGLGTLSLASFTFARVLSGVGAGERMLSTAHAADAMNRAQPAGGAAVAGSGGAFDPPPPSPELPSAATAAAAADGAPAGAAPGGNPAASNAAAAGAAAGDASSNDTSGEDGHSPPPDPSVSEVPAGADTSKRIQAGWDQRFKFDPLSKEEGGTYESPADGNEATPGGGAFDPPPPSLQLPDQHPVVAPDAPAPEAPGVDTSPFGDHPPPPDNSGEKPWPDTSRSEQAGYENKDHSGGNEGASDAAPTAPPLKPIMISVGRDVGTGSRTAPAATATSVSQADVDAAAAKAAAARTPVVSPGSTPPSGGGAFDPPPPSVDLPHDSTPTPDTPKVAGKSGTVPPRKKP